MDKRTSVESTSEHVGNSFGSTGVERERCGRDIQIKITVTGQRYARMFPLIKCQWGHFQMSIGTLPYVRDASKRRLGRFDRQVHFLALALVW